MKFFLKWLFLFLIIPFFLWAQDNETCLACHDDESLEVNRRGISISLYVHEALFNGTPHEGFECIDCHIDLDGVEDFHEFRPEIPDCGTCHEDAQAAFVDGFFQPLVNKGYTSIPACADCHGKHKITWKGQPRKVCGVCHQDVLNEFLHSAHWNEEDEESEVTCVSCHDPHFKHEKDSFSESDWKIHVTESCNECHKDQVENYTQSGHYKQVKSGNIDAPICSDCHAKHKVLSPHDSESNVSVAKLDQVCTTCHMDYEKSIHRPEKNDDPRLETCVVCHTGHSTEMVADAISSVFEKNLTEVCLTCHNTSLITGENDAHGQIHRSQIEKIQSGEKSDCGSCHDYHFQAPDHVLKTGLEKSCADCHPDQQHQYERSSHFIAKEKGHEEAPGCMDCHGQRIIQKPGESLKGKSVVELCGKCHGDRSMTMKFQLNPDVLSGYNTSYHGQMYQLGYQGEDFATCVSCHDNHSILPDENEASTISQVHIIETCGQCHENVNINFVKYLQHYSPMIHDENAILSSIHSFMIFLLGSVLIVFGGHTLLWLIRLIIRRISEGPIKKKPKSAFRVRRFGKVERLMHLGIILSFLTLAATGLPLKYSHTEFANWIANNIVGFRAAAILHRLGASLFFIIFSVHLATIFYKRFGEKKKGVFWGPDSLVPNWQDFLDFFNHIAYFIGAKKYPPKFGRWTYWEKFDYFAVFWGMGIIGASGLTLWFPEIFTKIMPGWLINAAHIIHSEEALLATGFIFTVHFFNTHMRPGAFPMDEVIFTGRMTEELFKEERSLEFENLSEAEYKARLISPLPLWMKRLFYIAGFTFLAIGFFLLVVIIIGSFF
ncbi:MAG: hypothetical protein HOD97_02670 [Candidatus Marinimicrobia bacterium]|jgi:cytochrome b subunit of formate dehydrogenase|nr:hypothetical protein [Candidatus Neomarinimicrobiota bacterium]MBT3617268.1 hypothetical protein [Candidatus Neomarinimicrobiota bacterium]MBT3828831.1 hypothetical protein [Candidatus Neomarinimicrobiota bacterium]MBT3997802.1 hypothetical protein [Candidatus Neomarinimicrobiota bacterium]MBT4280516.1 hypothetical protein [Candidatus Neomarinimicrobiota bacterium]